MGILVIFNSCVNVYSIEATWSFLTSGKFPGIEKTEPLIELATQSILIHRNMFETNVEIVVSITQMLHEWTIYLHLGHSWGVNVGKHSIRRTSGIQYLFHVDIDDCFIILMYSISVHGFGKWILHWTHLRLIREQNSQEFDVGWTPGALPMPWSCKKSDGSLSNKKG